LTPAHQVDLLTGIGPRGARIDASRTNPASGKGVMKTVSGEGSATSDLALGETAGIVMDWLRLIKYGAGLTRPNGAQAEFGYALAEFG
jgi:hypothetical protein